MSVYEAKPNDGLIEKLIALSAAWAEENSTYGYYPNERDDIVGNRIFLAEQDGDILGYLLGKENRAARASSIMADGTPFFEVEELYVVPEHRSEGIGRSLFAFAEQTMKAAGVEMLMLSTATKDFRRILHFYIDELGMDFWSARLYKRL